MSRSRSTVDDLYELAMVDVHVVGVGYVVELLADDVEGVLWPPPRTTRPRPAERSHLVNGNDRAKVNGHRASRPAWERGRA